MARHRGPGATATSLTVSLTMRGLVPQGAGFVGSTLMLSMLVALFVVPGALLVSLAATMILVVAISVLVATVAGPAVLTLLGSNINRWRIGPAQVNGRSRLMTMVSAALRRPVPSSCPSRCAGRPASSAP